MRHKSKSCSVFGLISALFLLGTEAPGQDPADRLCMAGTDAVSEEHSAVITVSGSVSLPIEAIQFAICHDESSMELQTVNERTPAILALNNGTGPGYIEVVIEEGHVRYYVIVNYLGADEDSLFPGTHDLLELAYGMAPGAEAGTTQLTFCNEVVETAFVDEEGGVVIPETCAMDILVLGGGSPPEKFIRGDASGNGSLNISDAIWILHYKFRSDREILCPDAADANDDGTLDLADPITILADLFGEDVGEPLLSGSCITDLSDDALGTCEFPSCQ